MGVVEDPKLTGVPFNDAYRYMDWLLTVPLLLIEILLVMNLDAETYSEKAKTLGLSSALMIVSGYYGELTVSGNLAPRWICWFVSMVFFLYICKELLIGFPLRSSNRAFLAVLLVVSTACGRGHRAQCN